MQPETNAKLQCILVVDALAIHTILNKSVKFAKLCQTAAEALNGRCEL